MPEKIGEIQKPKFVPIVVYAVINLFKSVIE